jgi:glycogen synthase
MLSQFYPPVVGGQERHVRNLAQALGNRGHQVEVATIAGEGDVGTTLDGKVPVHRLRTSFQRARFLYSDSTRTHTPPVTDPEISRAVRRLLSSGFDVVHAHDWIVASALGPAQRAGTPVVLTQHDYGHVCATKLMMRRGAVCPGPGPVACVRCASGQYGPIVGPGVAAANLEGWRRRRAGITAFISVSSVVAARTGLLKDGRSEVIPNFIPDELLVDRALPQLDGPLLYAGDLTRNKGVEVLLRAYGRLEGAPRLLLAGRVPDEPWLEVPDGAELLGVLPYDEVISHMRSASVVVVPSITLDPCPTVVLEAMAAGRPVVAARSGGIVDLVEDGVTGVLVPSADPAALADALAAVLGDKPAAAAMGQNGLERVRRFTSSAVVGRIEDLYGRITAGSGAATGRRRDHSNASAGGEG